MDTMLKMLHEHIVTAFCQLCSWRTFLFESSLIVVPTIYSASVRANVT